MEEERGRKTYRHGYRVCRAKQKYNIYLLSLVNGTGEPGELAGSGVVGDGMTRAIAVALEVAEGKR